MTPKAYTFLFVCLMLAFVVWAIARQVGAWRQSKLALASDGKYRALSDEYRRLSDLAITAQEHTDLRLADLGVQLDDLRERLEQMRRILNEVE